MAQNDSSFRPYSSSYGSLNGGLVIDRTEATSSLLGKVLGLVSVAFGLTAVGSYVSLSIPPGIAMLVMLLNFGQQYT